MKILVARAELTGVTSTTSMGKRLIEDDRRTSEYFKFFLKAGSLSSLVSFTQMVIQFFLRFPRSISPPPDASHKLAVENINIHLIISLGALLEHLYTQLANSPKLSTYTCQSIMFIWNAITYIVAFLPVLES